MFLPVSVKARERRIDFHRLFEHAVECPSRPRPLEALEPSARIDAAPGEHPPLGQHSVPRGEPQERRLRSFPSTAGAAPEPPVSRSSGGKATACALWRGSVKPTPVSRSSGGKATACALWRGSVKPTPLTPQESYPPRPQPPVRQDRPRPQEPRLRARAPGSAPRPPPRPAEPPPFPRRRPPRRPRPAPAGSAPPCRAR